MASVLSIGGAAPVAPTTTAARSCSATTTEAEALVVSPEEAAKVLQAKASASLGCLGVCIAGDKTVLESQRRTMFSQAIRDYNWQIAETLAASEAEVQDIADSKLRVDIFEEALEQGDSQKASEYAITNREYEKVSALRAASKA